MTPDTCRARPGRACTCTACADGSECRLELRRAARLIMSEWARTGGGCRIEEFVLEAAFPEGRMVLGSGESVDGGQEEVEA